MLEAPHVLDTPAQTIAVIPIVVPREQIQQVMGPGLMELMAAVAAQGVAVVGPWFTHHLRITPTTFDFEICLPIASPVTAAGRMKPSQRPAMRAARTIYHGGYEGLGAAWGEFDAWIAANGHKPGTDLWECYLQGPDSGPDPKTWRTELTRPLLGGA